MLKFIKNIKFEKSGLPIIPIGFFLVIFLSLVLILNIIKSTSYHYQIKGFGYPLENIKITAEMKDAYNPSAYIICYEDYCKSLNANEFRSYYFSSLTTDETEFYEKKVNKLYFGANSLLKDFPNNIKSIDINVGNKNVYLNSEEISKLEKKKISINLTSKDGEKNIAEYNAVILPEINNYRGLLTRLVNIFLSLFYNWRYFIIPYCCIFFSILIFIFNRDEFKFKLNINKKIFYFSFIAVLVLGAFLRLVDITYFPLWTDEVYTKQVAIKDFISCFKDAGNPPLYFILEYVFTKIFSVSLFNLRFLSFIFGLLFIAYTFMLFKDLSNKNKDKMPLFALFACFMGAVNTVNIYHSQEARGYSLCMFLIVATIYYFFKYLKNPNNKNLIIFSIFNIFLVNANYYLILFSLTNYVWGIVDLIQNKNKKEILKFTSVYLISFLTVIPYFIISFREAVDGSFNSWIPNLSDKVFLYTINSYFINKYVFFGLCCVVLGNLILSYIPKKYLEKINIKINPNKENLFLYLIYTLALIIIFASFISLAIKPIFHKRVLLSIYSLLFLAEMITIGTFVEFIKENKFTKTLKFFYFIILTLIYFTVTSPMPVREMSVNDFMTFIKNDIKQYDDNREIHVIVSDTKEYLKEYPEIYNNKKIKFHFLDTNSGAVLFSINKKDYISENKKGVIYFNSIGVDMKRIANLNPFIKIHSNNSITSAKLVY